MGRQSKRKQQRQEAAGIRDLTKYEMVAGLVETLRAAADVLEVTADTAERGELTPERVDTLRQSGARLRSHLIEADKLLAVWRGVSHAEAEQG